MHDILLAAVLGLAMPQDTPAEPAPAAPAAVSEEKPAAEEKLAVEAKSSLEVNVQTLAEETVTGTLVACDGKQITVETADGPVTLMTEKLLGLSPKNKQEPPSDPLSVRIEMIDGSSVAAAAFRAEKAKALITLPEADNPQGQTVETASSMIASVRLQAELDTVTEEWDRILNMTIDSDLLVVRKGDAIDYLRGVIGDVTDEVVHFEVDGDELPVKRSKVYGLVYYRTQNTKLPEAICRIHDVAGSQWAAGTLSLTDAVQWTTPGGLTISRPLAAIATIDFSGGKILYLSDMKASSVDWTPYFGTAKTLPVLRQFYAPRHDTNLESGPLCIAGQEYSKGLSLRSRTELVYRLPGRFQRFKATAGIDDAVRPGGHVRLLIRGDDRDLLDTLITGSDPPLTIDLDLSSVRRLTILVDFGEKLDVGDHLDLCNARFLK